MTLARLGRVTDAVQLIEKSLKVWTELHPGPFGEQKNLAECRVFTIFQINGACKAHEAHSSGLGSCLTCSSHGDVARLTVCSSAAESEAPDLTHPVSFIIITSLGLSLKKKKQQQLFPFMYSLLHKVVILTIMKVLRILPCAYPAYFS